MWNLSLPSMTVAAAPFLRCDSPPKRDDARVALEALLPPAQHDVAHAPVRSALACACDGHPALLQTAAKRLETMPVEALWTACQHAWDEVRSHDAYAAAVLHPLFAPHTAAARAALDAILPEAVDVIAALPAWITLDLFAIAWVAAYPASDPWDPWARLCEAGALLTAVDPEDTTVYVPELLRWAARRPDGAAQRDAVRQVLHDAVLQQAAEALDVWRTQGGPEALWRLQALRGALDDVAAWRSAATAQRASDPGPEHTAAWRTLGLARAVCAEVDGDVVRFGQILEDAAHHLPPESSAWRDLQAELLRADRMRGDLDGLASRLHALEPQAHLPELHGRWLSEHSSLAYRRRDLVGAVGYAERAVAAFTDQGDALNRAREIVNYGTTLYWAERLDDAFEAFQTGAGLASHLGATRIEAISLSNLCFLASTRGDVEAATTHGDRALAAFGRLRDHGAAATTQLNLGILAVQRGLLPAAKARFRAAHETLARRSYHDQRLYAAFNLADCAFAAGDVEDAYQQAVSLMPEVVARGDRMVRHHLARLRGVSLEGMGRLGDAAAAFEEGLAAGDDATKKHDVALLYAHLARVQARLGATTRAHEALTAARLRLQDVESPEGTAALTLAIATASQFLTPQTPLTDDEATTLATALRPGWDPEAPRVALSTTIADSLLVREHAIRLWLQLDAGARDAIELRARRVTDALVVEGTGTRHRTPDEVWHEAAARRNAARLLRALARAPDHEASDASLLEAVWPDERMLAEVASNRLHNAVAQLRTLGLRDLLQRTDAGYRLTARRVVVLGGVDPLQHPAVCAAWVARIRGA